MVPIQAVVKNGRVTLDEPTDMPDGQILVLLPLEDLLVLADDFSNGARMTPPTVFTRGAPKKAKRVDAAAIIAELRAT